MAIARINGGMLQSTLERNGVNIQIDSALYVDVNNNRIGVNNTSPAYAIDSPGNVRLANLLIQGNTITANTGKLGLGNIANITITGGSPNYILYTDGAGNLNFGNLNQLSTLEVFTGNNIQLGTNTIGVLSSNASVFTVQTSVTDAVAVLNQVLGNITNSGGNVIHVTGNVVAGNVVSNLYGTLVGNVTGNITGTVLTAAQPYITSLGTLTSLAITGNTTSGNVIGAFYGNLIGNVLATSQPYNTS